MRRKAQPAFKSRSHFDFTIDRMKPQSTRGQVLPLVAISLIVLLGCAALAVDAGYLQYRQRIQQTAADAAALAGAWQLAEGQGSSAATSAGKSAAASNGFTDGTNATVNVANPPQTGPHAGNTDAVEATVSASYPAVFSAVLGYKSNAVSTRAVAVVRGNISQPCIFVGQNFNISNGSVTGDCGVLVDGNVQANSKTVWNIPSIGAGGHIESPPTDSSVSTNIPPFTDPCAMVPGCKALVTMYPLNSNVANEGVYAGCGPAKSSTLGPNCYTTLNGNYDLTPGLVVISGDLTGSLTCTTCTSTNGVTIVAGGKVNLNGTATNLTAPPVADGTSAVSVDSSSGAAGVVLYQVRSSTSPENFSAQALNGMVYAPGAHIDENAGSTLTVGMLVVDDFVTNGNTITVTGYGGPNIIAQAPVLAE